MHDGTPIQAKVFQIKYNVLSQFITDAKLHPLIPKPIKKIIVVSQTGFDDSGGGIPIVRPPGDRHML